MHILSFHLINRNWTLNPDSGTIRGRMGSILQFRDHSLKSFASDNTKMTEELKHRKIKYYYSFHKFKNTYYKKGNGKKIQIQISQNI